MSSSFCDFPFEVPVYGLHGPAYAHALISVPTSATDGKPFPVIVLLEGRANLYDQDNSGRQFFDDGINGFILVTPKILTDRDSALLSHTNSQEDWRIAEDALFFLLQESLFEVERRFNGNTVDFCRIFCTGYSMGGDSCFGLASQPGVGRLLAGIVPFACKGEESLVYTSSGLDEFRGLRIWGLQNATERQDWKMHWMVKTLSKLADGADEKEHHECLPEGVGIPFEAPWLEGEGHVYKYSYGKKEVWEIADSQSSTWTERGLRFKHHNCWTEVMKHGVLGRFVTSWMLEGRNPNVDVAGELSYKLLLRRPVCKCPATVVVDAAAEVPWDHMETTRCTAQRLGIWASPEGVVGANISWKGACAPAHGKSIWVGDKIHTWKVEGRHVHLNFSRGMHLCWKPIEKRQLFEGALSTQGSDADFHRWFVRYEEAKHMCFQQRCLGNFEVAIRWNDASYADFSNKVVRGGEEESTAAETADEGTAFSKDPRLLSQANRDRRAFLASAYWTSMLCHGALDNLLFEYNVKLIDCRDNASKTEALRQAVKNKLVQEEFHDEPWRWARRIQRALRDARQPWLQMTVLNDRTGFDRAGVPITKKRIVKMEETLKDSDLFCFLEDSQWWTPNRGDGSKGDKELYVGLKSEVARRFPDKYKQWVRPEKTKSGTSRFCKFCSESEKRAHLASTHNLEFCKFAPKELRCGAK